MHVVLSETVLNQGQLQWRPLEQRAANTGYRKGWPIPLDGAVAELLGVAARAS
jgi:hypothetical protein